MFGRKYRVPGSLIALGILAGTARAAEPAGMPGLWQRLQQGDRDIREPWETRQRSHGPRFVIDNGNILAVMNHPTAPTIIRLEGRCFVDLLQTYHWNEAFGEPPGVIALQDASGRTYGPWQAEGLPGQGGVPDAYWRCYPGIELGPGEYQVLDSSPETWSWNAATGGSGMVHIEGTMRDRHHRGNPPRRRPLP